MLGSTITRTIDIVWGRVEGREIAFYLLRRLTILAWRFDAQQGKTEESLDNSTENAYLRE